MDGADESVNAGDRILDRRVVVVVARESGLPLAYRSDRDQSVRASVRLGDEQPGTHGDSLILGIQLHHVAA